MVHVFLYRNTVLYFVHSYYEKQYLSDLLQTTEEKHETPQRHTKILLLKKKINRDHIIDKKIPHGVNK